MSTELIPVPERLTFTREQVDLIKKTIAKGCTDDELKLFVEVCRSKQLDPFAREIYAIKRGDTMTIQTSIDGYRKLAERSGRYAGQQQYQWCGDDGIWKDVWLSLEPPTAAKAGIFKTGFAEPMVRIALFREYFQVAGGNSMWKKMPANQLAKCAESQALRAAFPELSGIYTAEEMEQAEAAPPVKTLNRKGEPVLGTVKRFDPQGPRVGPAATTVIAAVEEPAVEAVVVPEPEPVLPSGYGQYRVPSKELVENMRQELPGIPEISKAWNELRTEYGKVNQTHVLDDIYQKFGLTPGGVRLAGTMRTAIVVARNWKDDNLSIWLQPSTSGLKEKGGA